MLITLSRRTAICQSVVEVQLTRVASLGAVSHRFLQIMLICVFDIVFFWSLTILYIPYYECKSTYQYEQNIFSIYEDLQYIPKIVKWRYLTNFCDMVEQREVLCLEPFLELYPMLNFYTMSSYYHLPVRCRSLDGQCGSLGSHKLLLFKTNYFNISTSAKGYSEG